MSSHVEPHEVSFKANLSFSSHTGGVPLCLCSTMAAIPQATAELLDAAGLSPSFRQLPPTPSIPPTPAVAELSSSSIDQLEPFVRRNEPCVLRGILADWAPVLKWTDAHLRAACGEARVPVRTADGPGRFGDAERPGMYDAPRTMRLGELLDELAAAEARSEHAAVYAAQVRLRTQLPKLYADVRPMPPCVDALGPPWRNAPSVYIGCGARSPIHFDCMENLLCVVRGRKSIALWHPAHAPLLYPGGGGSGLFSQVPDVFDPACRDRFPLLQQALPLARAVELSAGDVLYLPCGWWHDVRTPRGERSISVSYWAQQPSTKAWQPSPADTKACDGDEAHGQGEQETQHQEQSEQGGEGAVCVLR
jgi:hypothetical protein